MKQEGDYVLGLKGNQSKLHEAVEEFFVTAQANNFNDINTIVEKKQIKEMADLKRGVIG